jgi:hypothetical protein
MTLTSDDILMSYTESWGTRSCKICGYGQLTEHGLPWEHTLTDCLEVCFNRVELEPVDVGDLP